MNRRLTCVQNCAGLPSIRPKRVGASNKKTKLGDREKCLSTWPVRLAWPMSNPVNGMRSWKIKQNTTIGQGLVELTLSCCSSRGDWWSFFVYLFSYLSVECWIRRTCSAPIIAANGFGWRAMASAAAAHGILSTFERRTLEMFPSCFLFFSRNDRGKIKITQHFDY